MGLESLTASSASAMNRLQSNVVKAITGYYRLKDFIHALRGCKTLSAERALIAKESFAIRTAFKEEVGPEHRYHSVAKLLYIYLLGYPAHFGQVECLKLAASGRMKDKRLGYLGVVLLLDEQQQTLTLVTNSLKNDLNSPNPGVAALALSTMAAIGSAEIAYELVGEVARLVSPSTAPYVRKKAAFCACRLVGRVPELGEYFEEKVAALVGDRNHAVAMGGISLAQALLRASPSATLPVLRRALVPQLCRLLQSLIGSGFSLDYDVGGLNDPFLQVKVLRLLRALGEGDAAASEAMADALTHLATAVDGNRNVGQAVLYEALTTILRVRSDDALRTMAVSILARLLTSHTDNNLRYVGLALLHRIVGDPACSETVQQHRSTVLECLGDPDFSIRKRAAEVALALANRATIRPIASHLMNTVLDPVRPADDAKSAGLSALVLTKLSLLSAQFAPSAKWYADTLVYLLACLHDDAKQATMASEIVSLFLRIVANTEEIHRYASELLWKETAGSEAGRRPTEALLQAAAWSVGEYGDLLVRARTAESFDGLVERVASWAGLDGLSSATLCYLITALGKLSHRHEASIPRIRDALLAIARTHARVVEVCGKATETLAFIQNAALRTLLFAKIPADTSVAIGTLPASMSVATAASAAADGIVAEPSRSESPAPALDVFAELAMLSLDGLASKASSSAASSLASNLPSPLAAASASHRKPIDPGSWGREAYSANGLSIYLRLQECDGNGQAVLMTVFNRLSAPVPAFQAQAAVPRSLRIALDPASSGGIPPNACLTQLMHISYASDEPTAVDLPKIEPAKLKLRLKITYSLPLSSQSVSEVIDFSNF